MLQVIFISFHIRKSSPLFLEAAQGTRRRWPMHKNVNLLANIMPHFCGSVKTEAGRRGDAGSAGDGFSRDQIRTEDVYSILMLPSRVRLNLALLPLPSSRVILSNLYPVKKSAAGPSANADQPEGLGAGANWADKAGTGAGEAGAQSILSVPALWIALRSVDGSMM